MRRLAVVIIRDGGRCPVSASTAFLATCSNPSGIRGPVGPKTCGARKRRSAQAVNDAIEDAVSGRRASMCCCCRRRCCRVIVAWASISWFVSLSADGDHHRFVPAVGRRFLAASDLTEQPAAFGVVMCHTNHYRLPNLLRMAAACREPNSTTVSLPSRDGPLADTWAITSVGATALVAAARAVKRPRPIHDP